jgi:hypothetical protein
MALDDKWQEMTKRLVLARLTNNKLRLEFRNGPSCWNLVGPNLIDELDWIKSYWDTHPLLELTLYDNLGKGEGD